MRHIYLVSGFLNCAPDSYELRWDIKAFENDEDAANYVKDIKKINNRLKGTEVNLYDPKQPLRVQGKKHDIVYGTCKIEMQEPCDEKGDKK